MYLSGMGAKICGYSLPPETTPCMFEMVAVQEKLERHIIGDVRDAGSLQKAIQKFSPDVVFHLAAQALVRRSYRDPLGTWSTNLTGTLNLLETVRFCANLKAVVVVTTDKCYKNTESFWGYRESDPLGGFDPYSASKAAAELAVQSYRNSYFSAAGTLVASVRAGNVIGGGDFSEDRLIPDALRAFLKGSSLLVRNSRAIRPWQHVLDPLRGYLLLAEKLMDGEKVFADAFNFGPRIGEEHSVAGVLAYLKRYWPKFGWEDEVLSSTVLPETRQLCLDSTKASKMLDWEPVWHLEEALVKTAEWYQCMVNNDICLKEITERQIGDFKIDIEERRYKT